MPSEAESQQLLAAIVSSSDDAILTEDVAGVITSWNGSAERLLGYTQAEAIGNAIDMILVTEDRVDHADLAQRIRRGEAIEHYYTRFRHKDGHDVQVVVTALPITGPNREFLGASTIARDITELERLERAARHLAAIVDASDDAIISKDLDGIVVSWNRSAERLFGYTAADMIGRSIRLIVPRDRQAEEDAVLQTIRRGGLIDHLETVRLRKDGSPIQISLTISPIRSSAGVIIGASKIARDLTGAKRAERDAFRLAAIVDSSDDAIVGKDLNSIVTSWNAAAARMFGYSAEEMNGQSIRRLLPADRQQEEDAVLSRIRRGERVEHYETIRKRKDGTVFPVSLTVSPILNADGVVIGASKIARDITERRRTEEERQRLLAIARDASRLKDEFLATLSHELRTPLNAIVGYLRLMQAGLLTGEKHDHALETVVRNSASLTRIVEDVLDVSRIISGKLRLDVQSVELPLITMQAVETVRPAAEAKGIRLETIVDPNSPPVSGDPERLQQMLWNLCSNAVKFTPRGGRVEVRVERVQSHVVVSVTDTGIGISEEFLPHVFERFRQADAGLDRARGGLGLGLAITRHLTELQGGRIFADSEGTDKGSTFRIELPVRSVKAVERAEVFQHPHASGVGDPMVVPELRGIRVLAVDDDRDSLALLREILEATGATVTTADSGQQALAELARTKPDVLVADLGMPQMDGFDLIDRVRHLDYIGVGELPAIALTAFTRSEDRTRALRSGFQLHLSKPIEPGELMAAIGALTRR